LVSARTLSKTKKDLPDECKNMIPLSQIFCAKSSYSNKTKIHETSPAQHTNNELKYSMENKKTAELKSNCTGTLDDNWQVKKNPWAVWLCGLGLEGETGSLILAAQGQAHNMHYHQRNIKKQWIVNAGYAIRRKNT
jgi:hypothetical protein